MQSPAKPQINYSLDFSYAQGVPQLSASLKEHPEQFRVVEVLGFEPSGEGEHIFLHIEKTGVNTDFLAKQLAQLAGIRALDVGYAGMKDRWAITSQWFSLYLPRSGAVDWSEVNKIQGVKLLSCKRHYQKLRRGQHRGNKFQIGLTQLTGDADCLPQRLETIRQQGVPNYFGLQRFGIEGNNLNGADRLFRDRRRPSSRHLRGIYISAARSYLFNQLLSKRVEEGSWTTPEEGDICHHMGPGTEKEVPTGPLWGRGRSKVEARILVLENETAQDFPEWCRGLEHSGLQQERRPLCLPLKDFSWHIGPQLLQLEFELPVGSYATSVVREICRYQDSSRQHATAER